MFYCVLDIVFCSLHLFLSCQIIHIKKLCSLNYLTFHVLILIVVVISGLATMLTVHCRIMQFLAFRHFKFVPYLLSLPLSDLTLLHILLNNYVESDMKFLLHFFNYTFLAIFQLLRYCSSCRLKIECCGSYKDLYEYVSLLS